MAEEQHKIDEAPDGADRMSIKIDSYTRESVNIDNVKNTDAFSQINRGITEADFQSRATTQWLLSEHDKYEGCMKQLADLKNDYHAKDKECAIAQEKLKTNAAFEVLYSSALSMGSALVGAFVSFDGNIKWLAISIGVIMAAGGIIAKLVTKSN